MDCSCCKNLGCYGFNQTIKFGIKSVTASDDYIYHIWSNGTYTTISQSTPLNDELSIPFTFNENALTTIKIELPLSYQDTMYGVKYVTTEGGSCCFEVNGLLTSCN